MGSSRQCRSYDDLGVGYAQRRQTDPRIAKAIRDALGDVHCVCNIGAGTGSYEPSDCKVVAIEPSMTMILQRSNLNNAIRAVAERLPFRDNAFDAAMTVLSIHHWSDPVAGLREMVRIAPRQVILTFDPDQVSSLWLARDYLPELALLDRRRCIPIELILHEWPAADVRVVKIPEDCVDGFQGAYWKRPECYLDATVRASMSSFAELDPETVSSAMQRLRRDLESGVWHAAHVDLLQQCEIDLGYRLIVHDREAYA